MLRKRCLTLLAVAMMCVLPAANAISFFQGFEDDISGWDVFNSAWHPTRVASGTNGITSASGDWHAEARPLLPNTVGYAGTDWGGYRDVFPPPGYWTRTDIYLDTSHAGDKVRFDYVSAINNTSGEERREFVFNVGLYRDVAGGPGEFWIAASNKDFNLSSPKNPARDPFSITDPGWYTFEHFFYDGGSGVLAVDLSIYNGGGGLLNTWTISNTTDIIGSTVGGNRYGWITNSEFDFLAFDNTQLAVVPEPGTLALFGLGLAGFAGKVARRRRRA